MFSEIIRVSTGGYQTVIRRYPRQDSDWYIQRLDPLHRARTRRLIDGPSIDSLTISITRAAIRTTDSRGASISILLMFRCLCWGQVLSNTWDQRGPLHRPFHPLPAVSILAFGLCLFWLRLEAQGLKRAFVSWFPRC